MFFLYQVQMNEWSYDGRESEIAILIEVGAVELVLWLVHRRLLCCLSHPVLLLDHAELFLHDFCIIVSIEPLVRLRRRA